MWLIVGLGNPGPKHQFQRHNIGFMAIDILLQSYGRNATEKKEHKSITHHFTLGSTNDAPKVITCKPQTFMNLSGQAVRSVMDFYKVPLSQIIVLHDEVDLPFAKMKIQTQRGHGGHNGIRDIHAQLGTNDYFRFKLGVDRPSTHPDKELAHFEVADFVLSNFTASEQAELPDFLRHAAEGVEYLILNGYNKAATKYNSAKAEKTEKT
jgi:peptidyl-tRNA hydrolase, PTH1 family